jgi:pyruvate,water dikinase
MVNARVAGTLCTANFHTGSKDEILIEASWGLGDSVIAGESLGDSFILDKSTMRLKDRRVVKKTVMVLFDERKGTGSKEKAVDTARMDAYSLTEKEARELGEMGLGIENTLGSPQEIDWAYENEALYILGSRDITNRRQRH